MLKRCDRSHSVPFIIFSVPFYYYRSLYCFHLRSVFSAGRKSQFGKLALRVPVLSIGDWLASKKTFHFARDGVRGVILCKNLNTERTMQRVPVLSISDQLASSKTFHFARAMAYAV